MGWDGGTINTMIHMVKSDRGQNRGCPCRCSYLSEIWFASSFENQMFFEIYLEFFKVFELNVSVTWRKQEGASSPFCKLIECNLKMTFLCNFSFHGECSIFT
jgi:hypothetical protein